MGSAPLPALSEPDPPARAGRREWVGLSVLFLATMMYVMDLSVLNLAVPALSADLQPTSSQLLWIIDIYGFIVAGLLITMGTLGDRIGRRKLLLVGAALFGVFSVLASMSNSAEMLIGTRALLGVAGATVAPSTLSLIFFMFADPGQRRIAIGIWVAGFSTGTAVGPILGGIVLEFFSWGAVFLLALPIVALVLLLGPRLLPEYRDPDAGRLDPLSAAMSIVAVLAVVLGVKQLAQDGADLMAFAAIVIGIVVGWLWFRRQLHADDPMIDVSLFRHRTFDVSLFVSFLTIFVLTGYFLFVAQYLQLVVGLSPFQAGMLSLPSAVSFVVGAQFSPWLVRRVRPAVVIGGGLGIGALGLLMLGQVGTEGSLLLLVASSVVISLGFAPVFGITTEMVVGSAPPEQAGAASGVSETAVELGGALGIAILGSIGVVIYRAEVAAGMPPDLPAELVRIARDTLGGAIGIATELPGQAAETLVAVARTAFVDGLHVTSLIAAVVAAGVAVLALVSLWSTRLNEGD